MDIATDFDLYTKYISEISQNYISDVVESSKKYNIYTLIPKISALNLIPYNQTKSLILDTYIEFLLTQSIDCYNSKYNISFGKFRSLINQIANSPLKTTIDPAENLFVQNIMFFGNYRVLNGIDITPAYNLQQIIDVLFVNKDKKYDFSFLNLAYILLNAILTISDNIIQEINCSELKPDVNRKEIIEIPSASKLIKYADLVSLDGKKFRCLFQNNTDLINLITINFGIKNNNDLNNKLLYTRPFLYDIENDKYILLNASILPSALVFWILKLAKKFNIKYQIMNDFNSLIFNKSKKYLKKLGYYKLNESSFDIELSEYNGYKEYLAKINDSQYMIVMYVYDDGTDYTEATLHSTFEKIKYSEIISSRLKYLYSKLNENKIQNENIFITLINQSIGRTMNLSISGDLYYPPFKVNPFELECISINEETGSLFINKYLKMRKNFNVFDLGLYSILDLIEIYHQCNNSFYIDDNYNFNENLEIFVEHGQSINYINQAIKKENKKMVKNVYGNEYHKIILYDEKRKIFYDPNYLLEKKMSYYLEFNEFKLWVKSDKINDTDELNICNSLLDTITYWLSECRKILNQIISKNKIYEIQIILSDNVKQYYEYIENPKHISESLKIEISFPIIKIYVSSEALQYLNYKNNLREKEFIKLIIDSIFEISKNNNLINDKNIISELNVIFQNPSKKKLTFWEFQNTHYLEPLQDCSNHLVQIEDVNSLLDEIGEELIKTGKWNIGIINNDERTEIAHEVVNILYKKLKDEVSTWSQNNLIEKVYDDLEKVLFNLMISQRKYLNDISCYPEKEQKVLNRINKDNQASLALKFLIEYVAAIPPNGKKEVTEVQYEHAMSICYLIIDWSYKNDLFHYHIFNTPIEILKSHRIGMKHVEFDNLFNTNEEIRKEQLISSSNSSQILESIQHKNFLNQINESFINEWGYSLRQLFIFEEGLKKYSEDIKSDTVYCANVNEVKEFLKNFSNEIDDKIFNSIINSVSLKKRNDFLNPPAPFKKEDIYPWRFNRELSFTRRPIILRNEEMIWGNRHFYHMIRFTLDLIDNGKLKAKSPKMNSLIGEISKERGYEFNCLVYKKLLSFNEFEIYSNINKINGLYISENNNALGDIDILIIDKKYNKIIASEVKNFNLSKNPYEMNLEYKKMFEDTKRKKCFYTKHSRRVEWCNKHIDDIKKQYNLEGNTWKTIGLFILNHNLPSISVFHKKIKTLTINELSIKKIRTIYK